jgi:hypothetical protein
VPLLFVGWQFPPYKLTIRSEYLAGMKPLAALEATINSISVRDSILLRTPLIYIYSHRRQHVFHPVSSVDPIFPLKISLAVSSGLPCAWDKRNFKPPMVSIHHPAEMTPV